MRGNVNVGRTQTRKQKAESRKQKVESRKKKKTTKIHKKLKRDSAFFNLPSRKKQVNKQSSKAVKQ